MEEEIKEVCQEQQEEEVVSNAILSSPLKRPFFQPFPPITTALTIFSKPGGSHCSQCVDLRRNLK
jgi:hypothetical protein